MGRHVVRLMGAVCLCVIASLSASEVRAHGVTLKIDHWLPADSAFQSRFLLPWKEKLETESDGHLRIQVHAAVQTENPSRLHDRVKDRSADIVWMPVDYEAGRFPAFEVFNLPLTMRSAPGSNRALWEYVQTQDLARKEFTGLRLLAVHVSAAGSNLQSAPDHTNLFVLAMNAQTYKSLPDELKKIINAYSGADISAWLGQVLDDRPAGAMKDAAAVSSEPGARRAGDIIEDKIKELDRRGLNGRELVESARALLEQYDPPN